MNRQLFLYFIFLVLISCKSNTKNVLGNSPTDYYIIIDNALQVMTISSDSIDFMQIVSATDDYFGSDTTTSFRTKENSVQIIETTKSDSQVEIYTRQDKRIGKMIFQLDLSKNKLSLLLEDTLFNNLKSAKKYKPDLRTKFLFDYYTKDYLLKFQNKPKVYNCDSMTIHRFLANFKNVITSNKDRINNTLGDGTLPYLLKGELLNKTFIGMDLNPFVRTRSDSLDAILKLMPRID